MPRAELVLHDYPEHTYQGDLIDSLISAVESVEGNRSLAAVQVLHDACTYLQRQFSVSLSNAEAKANIQARGILIWAQDDVLEEAEAIHAAQYPKPCRRWREDE